MLKIKKNQLMIFVKNMVKNINSFEVYINFSCGLNVSVNMFFH